jgi:hypothetical protein
VPVQGAGCGTPMRASETVGGRRMRCRWPRDRPRHLGWTADGKVGGRRQALSPGERTVRRRDRQSSKHEARSVTANRSRRHGQQRPPV